MKLPDDPFILELLPEFLETWEHDIATQFDDLVDNKKKDELYRFGHTIKGSCAQFGLPDISLLGVELMGYARNEDYAAAMTVKPRIVSAFAAAKEAVSGKP